MGTKSIPGTVILDQLANLYLPVPFDHKGHAAMASMTGGCSVCHHYTPENADHPACRTCHAVEGNGGDIRKPGLKGAYHRQCLSCHRDWGGEASCSICHAPRTGKSTHAITPGVDDLVGRIHPPIAEPVQEIYHTARDGFEPSNVLFRHKEHASSYDLKCSECHREDNCNRCHAAGKSHVQRVRSVEEHHQPCFQCHQNKTCESCHFAEGQSSPQPFSHVQTGWPLKTYHQSLGCRKCHENSPYTARSTQCTNCHSSWPSSFKHALTGLELDSTHSSFDCEQCHAQKNFGIQPTCNECHEAAEGIAYPAKVPGKFLLERGR
ncbi:MAG: cytochrome c3 family protein [Planctomycetes bacterium]|nr:cytochrome c3 family protein [Planctomycetota bacterium]